MYATLLDKQTVRNFFAAWWDELEFKLTWTFVSKALNLVSSDFLELITV